MEVGNIYINGEIGENVHLVDIIKQVQGQPLAISFNVYINSVGGIVDVGFDIYNYLVSLGKPITTIGNGIVASIATVIFMAGNERKLRKNTEFMIHLPSGQVLGTASEIQQYAEMLEKYEKKIIDFYVKQTGLTSEAIAPLLKNETWLDSAAAFDMNFTTEQEIDFPMVAKANFNFKPDNMTNLSNEDKSWIESKFDSFMAIFDKKGAVKNIMLQDATGVEIEFPDVMEGESPEVGVSVANVDGKPAEGEYLMPDGSTYVFAGGVLTEIKEMDVEDSAKDERIAELEKQLAEAKAENVENAAAMAKMKSEFKSFKSEIKSKMDFTPEPKEPKEEGKGESDAVKALAKLKQNKKK